MSTQPLLQRTATKRIALPVRVEPKVSFANERTFLSWLHFTVVLGGLAVGLLNFGDKVGKISAAMFSVVGECGLPRRLDAVATSDWPICLKPSLSPMLILVVCSYVYHDLCLVHLSLARSFNTTWRKGSVRR